VVLLAAAEGYFDSVPVENVPALEARLLDRFESEHPSSYSQINRNGEIPAELRENLMELMSREVSSQGLS
jgi:F0F1-type ATP synthase alpha subunit